MAYKNIKSTFAKKELQKTKWKDRQYISHLLDIEKFATTGYCSTGAGYIRSILKCKYPRQWKAIWQELNPQEYRQGIQREQQEREQEKGENEKLKKKETLQLRRDRLDWKRAGGAI